MSQITKPINFSKLFLRYTCSAMASCIRQSMVLHNAILLPLSRPSSSLSSSGTKPPHGCPCWKPSKQSGVAMQSAGHGDFFVRFGFFFFLFSSRSDACSPALKTKQNKTRGNQRGGARISGQGRRDLPFLFLAIFFRVNEEVRSRRIRDLDERCQGRRVLFVSNVSAAGQR